MFGRDDKVYALLFRNTDSETVKEITFTEFLEWLAAGYVVTQKGNKLILVKTVAEKSRDITVYLPKKD